MQTAVTAAMPNNQGINEPAPAISARFKRFFAGAFFFTTGLLFLLMVVEKRMLKVKQQNKK
jgi:hypothetical protein